MRINNKVCTLPGAEWNLSILIHFRHQCLALERVGAWGRATARVEVGLGEEPQMPRLLPII